MLPQKFSAATTAIFLVLVDPLGRFTGLLVAQPTKRHASTTVAAPETSGNVQRPRVLLTCRLVIWDLVTHMSARIGRD
jgi:hypothetical protein